MPSDIQRQLAAVRLQCRQPPKASEAEGEVLRAFKREVMEQRGIIMKALSEVPAFGPLDRKMLASMADATVQREVPAGEVIAAQDAVATEFYIVVSGVVRVSRRTVPTVGEPGGDREVNRLHAGSNFDAGVLLAGEQYFTTYEASGPVSLAVLAADDFHACTDRAIVNKTTNTTATANGAGGDADAAGGEGDANASAVAEAASAANGGEGPTLPSQAVHRVPIFSPLSLEQKHLVSNALVETHFRPGLYICEEGKPGSSFHIITSGRCRVTIHDPNAPEQRREVTKLHQDDFFGEVALMESGLRTATVVAETDVICLSLTRRHFDLYLKPIKAAILESAAAKELQLLDMGGDGEDFDDELDDDFDPKHDGGTDGSGGAKTSVGGGGGGSGGGGTDDRRGGHTSGEHRGGGGSNFRNAGRSGRRRKRIKSFRGVSAFALRVEKRNRIKFSECFGNVIHKPDGAHRASRRRSTVIGGYLGSSGGRGSIVMPPDTTVVPTDGKELSKTTKAVRSIARMMVLALENDAYAMLLDEMIERPAFLPECNKIVTKVLSEDLRRWDLAYILIRDAARRALGKGAGRLNDGELAVLSGMLRLHPLLRQRHCADWPEYHWAELCKRMRLEDVKSLDKVFVHGAHGTKCYIVLRGLARILQPEEDAQTGVIHYRPYADMGPGDMVGDSVLEGVPLRSTTVVAVTDCEFAVLDESDFTLVRDRGHSQMSLDDKCHFLKTVGMMRLSSTYHLYKIALLVKTADAAKDSVILRSGEPSKALYFIASGTVEVIQVRKRRVRSRYPGQGVPRAGATSGMRGSAGVATGVGGGGGGATTTGASPGDGEEAAEFVYKRARRVLTVLESGEYFGESGVITYFNGGAKATANVPPVTEQFSLVAGTSVELLVLRRKHFNIIEIPMLDILKANYDARLHWRARRKQEAHRGRAVLRAAKKALDQAATTTGGDDDPTFHPRQEPIPSQHSYVGSSSEPRMGGVDSIADGGTGSTGVGGGGAGGATVPWRPPRKRGDSGTVSGLQQSMGTISEMTLPGVGGGLTGEGAGSSGDDGDQEEEADDVSLAGLTLASMDSMQYSLDSGRFPNLRESPGAAAASRSTGATQNQHDDDDGDDHGAHPEDHRQDGQRWVQLPPRSDVDWKERVGNASGMESSTSLPNLLSSLGGTGGAFSTYGGAKDAGRAEERQPQQRLKAKGAGGTWGKAMYAGHKQPGLHGIKSFGPFWGDPQAYGSNPPQKPTFTSSQTGGGGIHSHTDASGAGVADHGAPAVGVPQQHYLSDSGGAANPKGIGMTAALIARDGAIPAAKQDAMGAASGHGRIGQRDRGEGEGFLGEVDDVVPSLGGASRRRKRGVELVPVRGISRVLSGS